jgi:hypothetical protein
MTKFRKLKSKDDISIQIAVLGKDFDAKIEMFRVIWKGREPIGGWLGAFELI